MFWEDESLRPPDIPNPTAHTVFNGLDESPGAEDAPQASSMAHDSPKRNCHFRIIIMEASSHQGMTLPKPEHV